MTTNDEKRTLIAKLQKEIEEDEENEIVQQLLNDIADVDRGFQRSDNIIVHDAVKDKYRDGVIPEHIMRRIWT